MVVFRAFLLGVEGLPDGVDRFLAVGVEGVTGEEDAASSVRGGGVDMGDISPLSTASTSASRPKTRLFLRGWTCRQPLSSASAGGAWV